MTLTLEAPVWVGYPGSDVWAKGYIPLTTLSAEGGPHHGCGYEP